MGKKRKAKRKKKAEESVSVKQEEVNVGGLIWRVTQCANSFLSNNHLALLPSQSLRLQTLISSIVSHSGNPIPSSLSNHSFLGSLSEAQWAHAFRMSKPSFSHLLHLLSPTLSPSLPHISPHCILAASLFRLAHAAPYSSLSRLLSISPSDACRAFFSLCKALPHLFHLRPHSPSPFPSPSLPNCFGLLRLFRFHFHHSLFPPNSFLILQALLDSRGRFLDVSAGWPSTVQPEAILRHSSLYRDVHESKHFLNGPSYNLNHADSPLIPQYILGDSCFPLFPWLLTPYNTVNEHDCLGSAQRAFNSAHADAMKLVDHAFGTLRSRWRLLSASRKWKRECVEYLPFVIVAGCLLHNFLVNCNEAMPDEGLGTACVQKEEEGYPAFDGVGDESGVRVRDALALHFSRTRTSFTK